MTVKLWECLALMFVSSFLASELGNYRATERMAAEEAQAHFEATWLCNYAARLSAKHRETHRMICLGNEFEKHFTKGQNDE